MGRVRVDVGVRVCGAGWVGAYGHRRRGRAEAYRHRPAQKRAKHLRAAWARDVVVVALGQAAYRRLRQTARVKSPTGQYARLAGRQGCGRVRHPSATDKAAGEAVAQDVVGAREPVAVPPDGERARRSARVAPRVRVAEPSERRAAGEIAVG